MQGVHADLQLPLSSEDYKDLGKMFPILENARKLKEQAQDREFTPGTPVVCQAPKIKVSIPAKNVSVGSELPVQNLNAIVVSTPESRLGIAYLLASQKQAQGLIGAGPSQSDADYRGVPRFLNNNLSVEKKKKGLKAVLDFSGSSSSQRPVISQMDTNRFLSPDDFQHQVDVEKDRYKKAILESELSIEDAIKQEKLKIQYIKKNANLNKLSVSDLEKIRIHKEVKGWLQHKISEIKTAANEEYRQERLREKKRKEAMSPNFVPRLSLKPKDSAELLSPYEPVVQKTRKKILEEVFRELGRSYEL